MKTENILTEAVEVCPYCEGENVYPNWDVKTQGYIAKCQHCGEEIMLCDECLHADDNPGKFCDWHEATNLKNYVESICFRGTTNHKLLKD